MSVCVVRVLTCNLKAPTASSAPSPASRIPEIESWRRRRRDDGAFPLPLTGMVETVFQLHSGSTLL